MVDEAILRRLSEAYDEDSRPVFLSLFADLSDPIVETTLERRAKEIEAALEPDQQQRFRRAWDEAKTALETRETSEATRGVAIFCAPEHELLEALDLAEPIPTKMVLDSSPYVRPLVQFADEHESFVLVLLDQQDAAVYLVEGARPALETASDTQPMGRHKKGGMSQARFQRHREGVLNQFFDEVAEDVMRVLSEQDVKRVIVAGPGQAKGQFVARAPTELQEAVIAQEDVDFKQGANDAVLAKDLVGVAKEHAHEEALKALAELRTQVRVGGAAAVGAFEAIDAAISGRVHRLIVLKDAKVAAQKCEEHQNVFKPGTTCDCGEAGNTVEAINEAIEFTLRQGGRVEFVEGDPFLEQVGGVGALLRF